MKIIDKIVKSTTEPRQTSVLWLNPETGELKIFNSNGWEVVCQNTSATLSLLDNRNNSLQEDVEILKQEVDTLKLTINDLTNTINSLTTDLQNLLSET